MLVKSRYHIPLREMPRKEWFEAKRRRWFRDDKVLAYWLGRDNAKCPRRDFLSARKTY